MKDKKSLIFLITSMTIFGTVGLFRRLIPMSSSIIAFTRGIIGALFIILFSLITRRKFSKERIKENLLFLIISGICIGFNWILLFEAYNYTTVATATLCYYMAPIFIIIVSPFLLKEKLSAKKIICVIVALVGMVFISGILTTKFTSINDAKGVLLGLGAAVLYASVILMNKKFKPGIDAYDKTTIQLLSAALILIPYILFTEDLSTITFDTTAIIMLLIVAIVHTGFAYTLYFGSISNLPAQTVAIFSYIDPVVAIILSAVFLNEKMGILEIIGAVLILGSTIMCELNFKKNNA